MKKHYFLLWVALSAVLFTGCASLRYDLGFMFGQRAYKSAKRHCDVVPIGFGSGYINGIQFQKQIADDQETWKDVQKTLRKLRGIIPGDIPGEVTTDGTH